MQTEQLHLAAEPIAAEHPAAQTGLLKSRILLRARDDTFYRAQSSCKTASTYCIYTWPYKSEQKDLLLADSSESRSSIDKSVSPTVSLVYFVLVPSQQSDSLGLAANPDSPSSHTQRPLCPAGKCQEQKVYSSAVLMHTPPRNRRETMHAPRKLCISFFSRYRSRIRQPANFPIRSRCRKQLAVFGVTRFEQISFSHDAQRASSRKEKKTLCARIFVVSSW